MPHAAFVVPGRFDARTGGSIYDRRMAEALRARGWSIDVVEVHGPLSAGILAPIADGTVTVVDGLVFGAAPDVVVHERGRLPFVPIVHLPLGQEVGTDPETAIAQSAAEQQAMTAARHVVVTGRTTADAVERYGVPSDRVTVIVPGTDPAPIAQGSGSDTLRLLCVAAVSPGKGHEILIRALSANRERSWMLTCVGSLERHPGTVEHIRAALRSSGLDTRVELAGELDAHAIDALFSRSDLFVLATLRETYGMAVAEAIARGVPVVSTTTGEIPAVINSEGGVLAAPGDADGFTVLLSRVLADARLRTGLRAGAIRARQRLPKWEEAASTMAAVLERVAASHV